MIVKSLLRMTHTTVFPLTSVDKIWKLLARRDITLVPVVDDKKYLVGVIGEDDLLGLLVPDYREYFSEFLPDSPDIDDLEDKFEQEILLTAKDVMNNKCITISPDQPIFKALSRMMTYKIRTLPVVDDEKKYLGMIIEDDIMVYLFNKHQHLVKKLKKL